MIFETVATGGCRSYVIGCEETCAAALIDPELSQIDRYIALAARDGLRIRYLIDTHTHADHFSATQQLARQLDVPVVMHRASPAPFVDLRLQGGEMLIVGRLRLQALHTPGHTRDSMCLCVEDRVFTGDTLLIGGTGRTDLPSGDAGALYESLFEGVLRLDPALKVFPAHEYKGRSHSTIGQELAENPRLQKRDRGAFIEMMQNLNLTMPTHVTEALRTNMSGGKTVAQMLSEAAATVPFMSLAELKACLESRKDELVVLDVRERDAFEAGPYPGGAAAAARPAGVARQRGAARSDQADSCLLRIRPRLDAGDSDIAPDGIPGRRGAGRRHEGVARGRLRGEGGQRAVSTASTLPVQRSCCITRTAHLRRPSDFPHGRR